MKKKGISLITLVITIVVVIILAAAVILSISKNNPINDAKKAKIASTIDTFKSDLSVQISNKLLKEPMITVDEIDSDEIKEEFKITDLVPSIKGTEYESELIVINGKLKLKKDSSFPKEKQEIIIELLGPIEEDNDDENEEIIPGQKTYQITYDVNGGNEVFANQIKKQDERLILNSIVPTKEGYVFEGWKATDGTIYQPGVEYIKNEETVLTAQWGIGTITLTFDANGGNVDVASITEVYGTEITLPTPTKKGYTFNGWYTESNGGENVTYTTMPDKSQILYANWTPITYRIYYNANGGTGSKTYSTHTYGVSSTLKSNTFTRPGYIFKGWSTTSSGSVVYSNGAYVNSLSSVQDDAVNLYAVWAENFAGTIYFSGGGSSQENGAIYYLNGSGGNNISYDVSASCDLPSNVVIEVDMSCGGSGGGSGNAYIYFAGTNLGKCSSSSSDSSKFTYTTTTSGNLSLSCGGNGSTNVGGGGSIRISIYNKSTGAYYKLLNK